MAIRTVNSCCGNQGGLVEHFIGTAYDVVKTVYDNLGELQFIYDFLNKYGVLIAVDSALEMQALPVTAKYTRIYSSSNAGERIYTDYLYVEGNRTGIIPNDPTATGSWIAVGTSNSGGGSASGGYIPFVYKNGSAIGGETTITVPDGTVGVPFIIVNGYMNYVGKGFNYSVADLEVTLAQPLEAGDEVVLLLTGIPAVPDNPNVDNWTVINWLYNHGAAVGGEQVIQIPYTFQDIPAVYKNGLRLYKGLAADSYTMDASNQRIFLTEALATNDRLIVQIGGELVTLEAADRTIEEVARSANVKNSEVILSTDTSSSLNNKEVIYDVSSQISYGLPVLPSNVFISSVSNGQLTYIPGNVTVNLIPLPNSVDILRADLLNGSDVTKGDALIKFKSVLPAAIERTLHTKIGEIVNVMDFGAVGDGVADDTAAFQAAIDSGARWIIAPQTQRFTFKITDTLNITQNNTSIDLNNSEIKMYDPSGLKSHILIQRTDSTQQQGTILRGITFTNDSLSTVYQVRTVFTGGLVVEDCVSWGPTNGHIFGFLDLRNAIMGYVRRCTTEGIKDASVNMVGTGLGANRTVDICIYDNRFVGGDYAIKFGDYSEGLFCRRNIFYAQYVSTIGIIPTSAATAIGSIKLQEIDFDSPNLTGSFLFIRYAKNIQVQGSWFAGDLNAPMIKLEQTDGVIISGNQAYPQDAFIADNGIGTTITDNIIMGGTVSVQFGALADKTLVASNNIRGVIVCVDANQHKNYLSVLGNRFEASSAGISTNTTNPEKHVFKGNSGDNVSGVTTSSYIPSSPYTTRVGSRPENISLRKATGVTQVVINDVEIFNSADGTVPSFIGVGELPPNTKIEVSFTSGNNPWLNRVKQ